ncbi:hypothetical protein ACU4GH_13990 [Bradyrhizobium betae]
MKTDDTYLARAQRCSGSHLTTSISRCARISTSITSTGIRGSENGRWVPTFAQGALRVQQQEIRLLVTEQNAKAPVPPFVDSVLPVVEAERARGGRQRPSDRRSRPHPADAGPHARPCRIHLWSRARDDAVFSGDLMHSPIQALYPEMSVKFDVDPAAAAATRRGFPRSLLRHRHAVLHRAFPLALGGEDPAQGQRVRLRGSVIQRCSSRELPSSPGG